MRRASMSLHTTTINTPALACANFSNAHHRICMRKHRATSSGALRCSYRWQTLSSATPDSTGTPTLLVIDQEVAAMKKAFAKINVMPTFLVIIASKRHHVRFFPQSGVDKNANPLPGTLVETGGTARPVHYKIKKIRDTGYGERFKHRATRSSTSTHTSTSLSFTEVEGNDTGRPQSHSSLPFTTPTSLACRLLGHRQNNSGLRGNDPARPVHYNVLLNEPQWTSMSFTEVQGNDTGRPQSHSSLPFTTPTSLPCRVLRPHPLPAAYPVIARTTRSYVAMTQQQVENQEGVFRKANYQCLHPECDNKKGQGYASDGPRARLLSIPALYCAHIVSLRGAHHSKVLVLFTTTPVASGQDPHSVGSPKARRIKLRLSVRAMLFLRRRSRPLVDQQRIEITRLQNQGKFYQRQLNDARNGPASNVNTRGHGGSGFSSSGEDTRRLKIVLTALKEYDLEHKACLDCSINFNSEWRGIEGDMRWSQPGKDTDTTGSDPLTSTITVVGVRKLFPVVDGVLSCWLRGGGGVGMDGGRWTWAG
ncbi:hypothetical protein D6D02_08955 [Aureobasidium pullulans]|nr:hypothetical protein D6D02_08955 [Aureobasidium pullulans]